MDTHEQEYHEITIAELEILYKKDYNNLISFAQGLSGNIDVAEDLVHEVYLRLIRNRYLLRKENLKSYVLQSIKNKFVTFTTRLTYERSSIPFSHFRDESLEKMVEFQIEPDINWINEEELTKRHEIVIEAMNEMRPITREVFQYRVIQGLSARETADITGRTERSIKMSNHRAYKVLRGTLARHGIEWNSKVPYIFGENSGRKNVA